MADHDGFDTPPTSMAALQALSIAARRGESRAPRLTPGGLKLLEQLLAAPELAATLSISALARQHGVNASSLTRLAHALELTGFKAFQALFRADAANGAFNLLKSAGDGLGVGPLLLGAAKPVHILTPSVTSRGVVNISALAVLDAQG